MGRQVETVSVSLLEQCRSEDFAEGFIQAAKGLAFDDRYGSGSGRSQWLYERGRAVATGLRARLGRVPPLWVDTDLGSCINPLVIDGAARDML